MPRKYAPGRRRVSVYIAWSYPAEASRNPAELDNRFSTMTEVRRVVWPAYEAPQWSDPLQFQQGIAGSLELFFWAWVPFQQFVGEMTGHAVPVFQRVDQAGFTLPLDERVLADTDTLFVFGLDHMVTEQVAAPEEIEAVREFLDARRDLPRHRSAPRRRRVRRPEGARHGVPAPRRRAGAAPAALRAVHALADEGARHPRRESLRAPASTGAGNARRSPP